MRSRLARKKINCPELSFTHMHLISNRLEPSRVNLTQLRHPTVGP